MFVACSVFTAFAHNVYSRTRGDGDEREIAREIAATAIHRTKSESSEYFSDYSISFRHTFEAARSFSAFTKLLQMLPPLFKASNGKLIE